MESKHFKRAFNTLLALVLIVPTFLVSMIVPLHVGANVSNPWVTISSGGNEINAIIEQNGKSYVR
ncbi:hypothetical protein, partial [Bacillus mobilis]